MTVGKNVSDSKIVFVRNSYPEYISFFSVNSGFGDKILNFQNDVLEFIGYVF